MSLVSTFLKLLTAQVQEALHSEPIRFSNRLEIKGVNTKSGVMCETFTMIGQRPNQPQNRL